MELTMMKKIIIIIMKAIELRNPKMVIMNQGII